MKKLVLGAFLVLQSLGLASQELSIKYGEVSKEELKMDSCDFYPDASAMILGRTGELKFLHTPEKGWQFTVEVTERVKIFNQSGKRFANIKIRLYDPANKPFKEDLEYVKGFTYNLVTDKVEKTKLATEDKFESRINDYWVEKSFTFPNVQEGSVIEYRYMITSDYLYNLRTWYFQDEIPVGWCNFSYILPEYFTYQILQMGTLINLEKKSEEYPENIFLSGGSSGAVNCLHVHLTAKKVPPVEDEPYLANAVDLPNRLEFQLVTYRPPRAPTETIAEDYEVFTKKLLEEDNFGKRLSHGEFAEGLIAGVPEKTRLEVAAEFLAKLQDHFIWNEIRSYASANAGPKAFKEKTGTAGDINLSLIAGLRYLGFEVYPLILSTRGAGVVNPVYPSYDRFDYVIALVMIEGKDYFADATGRLPLGVLPERCLNGKGWVAGPPGKTRWVDLRTNAISNTVVSIQAKVVDGQLKNSLQIMEKGYSCYGSLDKYSKEGESAFTTHLEDQLEDLSVANFKFEPKENKEEVRYQFDVHKEMESQDIIYLSPLLFGAFDENPFSRPTRKSVVDFPFGQTHNVVYKLDIPEGYTVELPKSEKFTLLNNSALFSYTAVYDEATRSMRINSNFSLKRTVYTPEEYQFLREFFQLMGEKNKAPVVLRKI